MNYTVSLAGRTFEVEVDARSVRIDGRAVSAELMAVTATPLRQLVVDGRSRTFAMVDGPGGWAVMSGGEWQSLTVEDERTRRLRQLAGAAERSSEGGLVTAPMPGLVLRVEVEKGQVVASGAGVLVLEAMKMENEIRAPAQGVVSAIHVQPGQAVDKGMVLVELSSEA